MKIKSEKITNAIEWIALEIKSTIDSEKKNGQWVDDSYNFLVDYIESKTKSLSGSERQTMRRIGARIIKILDKPQPFVRACSEVLEYLENILEEESLWDEYLDEEGLLRELERRERIKNMQKSHNKIESKAGIMFVEKVGEQEESERIKVYDSNGRYLDYFSVESIAEAANTDNITLEEEYEKYISRLSKCETAEEVVNILGTNTEIIETDETKFVKKLADFVIDDDYDIDNNECVNVIGEYYILIKE